MAIDPAEVKLAALALYEALRNKDVPARQAVMAAFEPIELISGLVGLVASLMASVAADNGVTVERAIEIHRCAFVGEAAER